VRLLGEVPVHAGASEHSHPTGPARPRPALEDKIPDLKSARQGARERLGDPGCLAVLTDFESVNGGRLDLVLRSTGRTAQEQIDRMVFESGLGRHVCAGSVLASTHVGASVVSICLRPFTLLDSAHQEAVLIHEMLHSLGLGENPPESVAITAQVLRRCGH
jgi:hypothetical protein